VSVHVCVCVYLCVCVRVCVSDCVSVCGVRACPSVRGLSTSRVPGKHSILSPTQPEVSALQSVHRVAPFVFGFFFSLGPLLQSRRRSFCSLFLILGTAWLSSRPSPVAALVITG
jgi:hypothetical protein